MINKDVRFLEEAYLSISKKSPLSAIPTDKEIVSTNPNELVSSGPATEPAPGIDVDMIGSQIDSRDSDTTGIPVDIHAADDSIDLMDSDCMPSEEDEEDAMSLDNLNSIRESIVKIASFCSKGGHLETWQQQKLAIAMDNLAEIARSVR
jgi:hypothetical protein